MPEYFWEYFSQKMQDPGFSDGEQEVRWTSYISRGRLPPGAGRYHPTRAILQYGTLKRTAWHAAAARLAWPRRRRRLLRLGACEGEGPADYPPPAVDAIILHGVGSPSYRSRVAAMGIATGEGHESGAVVRALIGLLEIMLGHVTGSAMPIAARLHPRATILHIA